MPPSGEAPFSPADERNTSPLDERGSSSLGERGISPDSECSLSKNSITILSISYMRRNLSTLFLGAALLFAATSSCTNELPDGTACGDAAISFRTPAVTRAAVEGDFPEGSQFSVWGWYDNNGSVGNPFDNIPVTYDGTRWSYTGGDRYWVLGAEYDFYAVYPAGLQNVDCTDQGVVTVTGFDASKTGNEAVDLMTARKTDIVADETVAASAVELGFGHELARISLNVTSEGDAVTLTNVKLSGVSYKGNFESSATPKWSNLTANTSDDGIFSADNVALTTDALSASLFGGDLLLPPHDGLTGISLTFSYQYTDDVSQAFHEADLSLATGQITAWSAGNHYNYTVNIPRNGTDVTLKVTVTDWTTEDYTVQW